MSPSSSRRMRCPAHEGLGANCSVWRDLTGRLRAKCWSRGCDEKAILIALDQHALELSNTTRLTDRADRSQFAARSIWDRSRPADGTMVERYLRGRGITISPSSSIHFHPSLRHPSGRVFPAMVAAVEDRKGRFVGIHRTFLRADGSTKAAIEPAKMSLGQLAGGAVHLAPKLEDKIVVTEGIEDGLSIAQATGLAVWAALGTSGLRKMGLPDSVREVIIAADNDEAGESAALDLAQRVLAEGRRVKIAHPSSGKDFNDLLRGPK